MTNIQAALGLAQLERIDWHLQRRREIANWYYEYLRDVPGLIPPVEKKWARNAYWMFSVVLDDSLPVERDAVMASLYQHGIETRPFFYPMHTLPPYRALAEGQCFPVADQVAARGINLPTWVGLTREDVNYVCSNLLDA